MYSAFFTWVERQSLTTASEQSSHIPVANATLKKTENDM